MTSNDVANLDRHSIAATQLAVDGKIKECFVSQSAFMMNMAIRIHFHQRALRADSLTSVSRYASLQGWIKP